MTEIAYVGQALESVLEQGAAVAKFWVYKKDSEKVYGTVTEKLEALHLVVDKLARKYPGKVTITTYSLVPRAWLVIYRGANGS